MKVEASDLKFLKAKNRVEKLKKLYNHLAVYIIVNLIITGFKVANNLDSWDNFISELFSINVLSSWTIWGCVLIIHLVSVVFFQGWEERKIEEYMNNDSQIKRYN